LKAITFILLGPTTDFRQRARCSHETKATSDPYGLPPVAPELHESAIHVLNLDRPCLDVSCARAGTADKAVLANHLHGGFSTNSSRWGRLSLFRRLKTASSV